jgi:L-glutamine-phosphate cytidylyltransferase
MEVVILAAGRGRRLIPATDDVPKCLVEFAPGVTILERQLSVLADCPEVDAVCVVVGHRADQVETKLATTKTRLRISTIHNPSYETTNALKSLALGVAHRPAGFAVLNGDTIIGVQSGRRLFGAPGSIPIALAFSPTSIFTADAVRVAKGSAGELVAIGKGLESPPPNGESLGLARFAESVAAEVIETIERLVAALDGEHAYWYTLLQRLAETIGVHLVECAAADWLEVDDPEDLIRARRSSHARASGMEDAAQLAASS